MINRTVWQCDSCGARTIVRIGFSHDSVQRHAFPCPTCGVEIEVVLHLDQKYGRWRYERGKNATQVGEEDGATEVRTFYPGVMVPDRDDEFVSPFVETILNIEDPDRFGADETGRQIVIRELWPKLERAHVHFERDNGELFDRELQGVLDLPPSTSRAQRADRLALVTQRAFAQFTQSTDGQRQRVRQRLTLAQSIDPNLMAQIAKRWLDSGRMANLWTQVRAIRRAVLTRPARSRRAGNYSAFELASKYFHVLHGLTNPSSRRSASRQYFINILNKYPIADLFAPAMGQRAQEWNWSQCRAV